MTTMFDKRMTADAVVASLSDGMTIGIGGWATRRKPMALIRAILRSDLKDLTIVSYGGPDVGMLCAAGKVKKLVFAFVSLDHYPLDPHFRAARQTGAIEVLELDEGMFHWGLRAAAMDLPFLPTRIGIGTDIITQPGFRMVKSPYDDGEELVAMPALRLDAALIHAHRGDAKGNLLTLSPDPFFDELFTRAAPKVYASVEQLVPTADLDIEANARFALVERARITGVVEAPLGAHPTGAAPDYQIDLKALKTYVDSAASPEAWADYRARFVDVSDEAYAAAIGGRDAAAALPRPVY
ncbi:acyl CoA--acetate/3-ketoacid CoA transferase subunit alpha [Sphingomonas sp. RP10(2022)]|uniref:Acyl CoA--acetate/3-ketoacid CoA transferase subunit alpha n=1 Tax=Sphingomonas liriopis TaxID=2949094 RepID=A0A9X2KP28_9SPHN|nr:CoA-transferase [Sphingomonas liriopis]MCP3733497.1 acyl CoA--acetate/3-ketoacid CoA transferase subunit alpha [Sphingomonas liriopis]